MDLNMISELFSSERAHDHGAVFYALDLLMSCISFACVYPVYLRPVVYHRQWNGNGVGFQGFEGVEAYRSRVRIVRR